MRGTALTLPLMLATIASCQDPEHWSYDVGIDADGDGYSGGDGDGDGAGDLDADVDGDSEADDFVLTSPADGARFYRRQLVTFTGHTPGPMEARADEWQIGSAAEAGEFSFDYAFENAGDRTISFLVDGVEVRTISLVIEPSIANVCLSPGHPSSPGDKLFEACINRKVAFYLEDMLLEAGYDVLIVVDDISEEDIFAPDFDNEGQEEQSWLEVMELGERTAACNDWPADYFISIHHNAVDNPEPNYTLVLYGERSAGSPRFPDAVTWAELTADALFGAMDVTSLRAEGDRSFLGFGLFELQNTDMIGILTEGSFYSNPEERARLNDNDYLLGEAVAIFDGFIGFVYP